jgi:hypothetical protein
MSGAPIAIDALVDPLERPGLVAAAEQLSACLGAAAEGADWPVRLNFRRPGDSVLLDTAPTLIVTSLLPEVAREEPIAETDARWRAYLDRLKTPGAPVFVCTVFRHVAERSKAGATSPLLARIRRLNRLAVTLSQELDVGVIDLDRVMAHIGGRALNADYRLSGVVAAEVAGHTAAWAMLSWGLDDAVDPMLQEKAKEVLGDLNRIDAVVSRRLNLRRARAAGG